MNSQNVSYYKCVSYFEFRVGEGILTPDIDTALALRANLGIVSAEPRSFAEAKILGNGLERYGGGRFEFQFRDVRVNTS